LEPRAKWKLGPRYTGPLRIVERIGQVAYRLALPEGARLHDVFHVGLLKPFYIAPPPAPPPLPTLEEGRLVSIAAKVLQARRTLDSWELQVEWEGEPDKEITWEPLQDFKARFPAFQLDDELFVE
jgi:hypothetical protein